MYLQGQSIKEQLRDSGRESNALTLNLGMQSMTSSLVANEQLQYTHLFETLYSRLNRQGWRNIHDIRANISDPSQYQRMRQAGVKSAWNYEKASVRLGGRGSANWNRGERAQIMNRGTVKGSYGHHQMNVHDHPEFMKEAFNIRFFKSLKEHLMEGHGGNFRNESNKEFINKDLMLIHDYERGIIIRELYGAGSAALIGYAATSSISIIVELALNDNVDYAQLMKNASVEGMKGAGISTLYYGGFRIGGVGLEKCVTAMGTKISPELANFIKSGSGKMLLLGGAIILADSVYQTGKDFYDGNDFGEALMNTARKEALPIGLLALSAINLPAGIVAALASVGYDIGTVFLEKKTYREAELKKIDAMYMKAYSHCMRN